MLSEKDQLDKFVFDTVKISKYSNVSFVIELLLTLIQAQASVEEALVTTRAFSKPT